MFLNVCKQTFHISSRAHISRSKRCFNVKSSTYYFHMKEKILADFEICIIVPSNIQKLSPVTVWNTIKRQHHSRFFLNIYASFVQLAFSLELFLFSITTAAILFLSNSYKNLTREIKFCCCCCYCCCCCLCEYNIHNKEIKNSKNLQQVL